MRVQRKKVWSLVLITALLLVALLVFAGCGTNQTIGGTNSQTPTQQPAQSSPAQQQSATQVTPGTAPEKLQAEKPAPIMENATFEMGHMGWSPQEGTIETEENGNKYIEVRYTWGLYQFLQVKPGESYQTYCKVKQGTEPASPARISVIFYDKDHKIMPESQTYFYNPGTEWCSFPKNVFKVPENALFTKLFLLSDGKGTVCFDNVSVSLSPRQVTPATPVPAQ